MKSSVRSSFARRSRGFLAVSLALSVSACGELQAPPNAGENAVSQALVTQPRQRVEKQKAAPTDSLVFNPHQKLVASDGTAGDELGSAVALAGDFAFVGAQSDDVNGKYSGSVYIFERTAGVYTQTQKLTPSDAAEDDSFGLDLAASGDTLIVGANGHGTQFLYSGAAYVFVRNGNVWTEQAKLVASDEKADAAFGWSVDLSGDTALVGASWDDASGFHSGAAYVFTRNSGLWTEQQKLVPGDGVARDEFSDSLALDGDTALFGAPYHDNPAPNSGAVYVFERTGGIFGQTQKLYAADAQADDQLGFLGLALSGSTAVAGAPYVDIGTNTNQGALYTFERFGGAFVQTQKLAASNGQASDLLGTSIALEQDTLVAGTHLRDEGNNNNQGAAYVFERNGFLFFEKQKIIAADGAPGDLFGYSVALAGSTLFIGADGEDIAGYDEGSAYVFNVPALACSTNAQCASGFCVDGVCCDSACGGGNVNDCMACSIFAGAAADGTCSPLEMGTVCRKATSGFACDAPEMCDGISSACPADAAAVAGVPCRVAVDACDKEEQCNGLSKSCPPDATEPAGTLCRAAVGPCDAAETCDGIFGYCPIDVKLNSTTTCRPAPGVCDVAETCDGTHNECPNDRFVDSTVECRPKIGDCDVAEHCNGLSADCPPDGVIAGQVCRLGTDRCDASEYCNGTDHQCPPDEKEPAGTPCRVSVTICDVTETCDGINDKCPADQKFSADTECRPPAGPCDAAETCDGSSDVCPPDVKLVFGTICRESSAPCDTAEQCNGSMDDCPVDDNAPDGAPCAGGICSNGVCSMVTTGAGSGGSGVKEPEDDATCVCRMPGAPKNGNGWARW